MPEPESLTEDEFPCPSCDETFPTEVGKRMHHTMVHGTSISNVILRCEQCGDPYEIHRSRAAQSRFCSRECRRESAPDTVTLTCEQCGDEFTVPPYRADRRKFCSRECWRESPPDTVTLTCEVCGDEFTAIPSEADGRRFCSRQCYGEHKSTSAGVTLSCVGCGEVFIVAEYNADNRGYCSIECKHEHGRDTATCERCGDGFETLSPDSTDYCINCEMAIAAGMGDT